MKNETGVGQVRIGDEDFVVWPLTLQRYKKVAVIADRVIEVGVIGILPIWVLNNICDFIFIGCARTWRERRRLRAALRSIDQRDIWKIFHEIMDIWELGKIDQQSK